MDVKTRDLCRGQIRTVAALIVDGECLVESFLETLKESDQKKVAALFKMACGLQQIRNREKFKMLGDGLCEFKCHQVRVIGFMDHARRIILTHGFIKKTDDIPPAQLERASRLRNRYETGR